MPKTSKLGWCAAALILAVLLPSSATQAGRAGPPASVITPDLPPGFEDSVVATVSQPTALAFTPDGRLLIGTQTGRIRVVENGSLKAAPALNLAALGHFCDETEQGLVGLAADPAFATNNLVYVYYTSSAGGPCSNRVARFVLPSSNVIDPSTEAVLIDRIPSPAGYHNGGDLGFGKDGLLYVTVGDGGCDYAGNSGCDGENDASRDLNVLLGKVLRITPAGGIPATNPFQGEGTARCNVTGQIAPALKCQETFASGLRNPFRFAFDPNAADTQFFVNDVGESHWEEIELGTNGADYGWNVREGPCRNGTYGDCGPPPPGMTNPIFSYRHDTTGCGSITGGAFVPNGVWPAEYDGDYLYADYVCGKIFRLEQNGGTYSSTPFAEGLGGASAVHMEFGPAGSLYYTTYFDGGDVHRIAFTGGANRAPTADLAASPTSGPAPLDVDFDGTGSSDPDAGDTLTYVWDFGDGSQIVESAGPTISHTYTTSGSYTASLQVRDNHGATSVPDTVRIDPGNTAPLPTIAVPTPSQRFAVGEQVVLQGTAVDAQDGQLPSSSLSWTVLRHHGTSHTHPWLTEVVGNNVPMPPSPSPEDVFSASTSYLEIRLTATDSNGLSATTVREFRPRTVDLTFATVPTGLHLELFAADVTAPFLLPAWDAWQFGVSAARQKDSIGRTWIFDSWSDGGATSHTITTGTTPTTYTASFHENRAPVASSDAVSAVEDTAKTVTLQATDADADPVTYNVTRLPANGTVGAPSGNHVVYTPGAQFNGTDSFGFTATDGDAASSEANVAVTVTPVNDAPVAGDDAATTPESTSVLIDVAANDRPGPPNESGQSLTLQPPSDPPHGAAVIEAGKVRYTPEAGFAGLDAFSYSTCDNGSPVLCASATVSVNVAGVGHAPVASPGSASVVEDVSLGLNLLADDQDGDQLSFTIVTPPSHGTLAAPVGASVLYTPAADYNGPDSFAFKASDGHAESGSAAFSLTVTAVNDPPVAVSDVAVTAEDSSVVLDLVANDLPGPPNESGQVLRVSVVGAPAHGSAILVTSGLDAGKVRYTPAPDYNGPDAFGYRVCDNGTTDGVPDPKCAGSATVVSSLAAPSSLEAADDFTAWLPQVAAESGSATLTVTAVNDPPVAVSDVAAAAEDSSVVLDLVANDLPGPPNESGQVLRVSAVGSPGHGSAVLVTSGLDAGKVRYTPAPDYNGPDAFGYRVCDDGTTDGVPDPKCAGSTVAFSFSAPRSPLSIALPKVAGRTIVGRSVQADPGRWSPGARDTEFEWLRCNLGGGRCASIPRATDASYVPRVADIGRRLRVRVTVANRFGRSSALSASTPPIRSPIVFSRIVFDPPTRSERESIALKNVGVDGIQLRGWTIGDGDGNLFRFRTFGLRKGQSVSVQTGTGIATATRRVWRRHKQVWDDRGERAVLRTPNGALADSCRYRAARSGAARC